jgi:ring-1,2-phenylacetyl-CoA epoxidase subunit PaaC
MTVAPPIHVSYLLRIADGSLILAQRLAEWCGHGPVLEEDIAFANIALDLLGQARLLYSHAGIVEGQGRSEDDFAYWRDEQWFLNPTLVELPNGDFAQSVLRTYAYTAYQLCLWQALVPSVDAALAAIAQKSHKETAYHCTHLARWVVRLGDGTAESRQRIQRALDYLWPYTQELFTPDAVSEAAAQANLGPLPATLADAWGQMTTAILTEATLQIPGQSPFRSTGSQGLHSEYMGYILHEMQALARAHPGAKW